MNFFIWANLKMNKSNSELSEYLDLLNKYYSKSDNTDLVIFPNFTNLQIASEKLNWKDIYLWAQNMYFEESWSFTWEISPKMLKDFNCKYVILGHSERRINFHETNNLINKKITSAIKHDLKPILCIWENIWQKNAWLTKEILKNQLLEWLLNIHDYSKIIIAYEPIWAVWTWESASPEYIEEINNYIKEIIWEDSNTKIIYWWSINEKNTLTISKINNVDWFLIWKQALDIEKLLNIINNF